MIFLGHIAQLNLVNILNRFVPEAHPGTLRLVLSAYAVAAGLAVVASTVFLIGISQWAPEMGRFTRNIPLMGFFVLSAAAWSVFGLQDSVLAGLRRGTWVLGKNLVFSVLKIVLLIVFVGTRPEIGIFISWSAAVLPILLVMTGVTVYFVLKDKPDPHQPPANLRMSHLAGSPLVTMQRISCGLPPSTCCR